MLEFTQPHKYMTSNPGTVESLMKGGRRRPTTTVWGCAGWRRDHVIGTQRLRTPLTSSFPAGLTSRLTLTVNIDLFHGLRPCHYLSPRLSKTARHLLLLPLLLELATAARGSKLCRSLPRHLRSVRVPF